MSGTFAFKPVWQLLTSFPDFQPITTTEAQTLHSDGEYDSVAEHPEQVWIWSASNQVWKWPSLSRWCNYVWLTFTTSQASLPWLSLCLLLAELVLGLSCSHEGAVTCSHSLDEVQRVNEARDTVTSVVESKGKPQPQSGGLTQDQLWQRRSECWYSTGSSAVCMLAFAN